MGNLLEIVISLCGLSGLLFKSHLITGMTFIVVFLFVFQLLADTFLFMHILKLAT